MIQIQVHNKDGRLFSVVWANQAPSDARVRDLVVGVEDRNGHASGKLVAWDTERSLYDLAIAALQAMKPGNAKMDFRADRAPVEREIGTS